MVSIGSMVYGVITAYSSCIVSEPSWTVIGNGDLFSLSALATRNGSFFCLLLMRGCWLGERSSSHIIDCFISASGSAVLL